MKDFWTGRENVYYENEFLEYIPEYKPLLLDMVSMNGRFKYVYFYLNMFKRQCYIHDRDFFI